MAMTSNPSNLASIVRAYIDAVWNRRELHRVPEFLHPQFSLRDPRAEVVKPTREEFTASIRQWLASVPTVSVTVTDTVTEGNVVASRWELVAELGPGALQGPLRELSEHAPGLRVISVTGMTFSTFEGDQIIEEVTESDCSALLEQMGIWVT